ncbi:MAG: trehalose-6-phosphate synthase [Acetobacteraceae bacterium]|nr:trehalose-6-phosphate synthase [Acetobacteraceae bacterium]
MNRLVVVSNRVPAPSAAGAQAGGLAVALEALMQQRGGLWFGWSGRISSHTGTRSVEDGGVRFATIDLTAEEHDRYYNEFSNGTLWPLLHSLPELMTFDRRNAQAYRAVNERFAESLLPLLRPGDLIWIHDYHLLAMPAALRARGVTAPVGFFLHIPFPSPDMLASVPESEALVRDLLSADLIGFQTENDASNFGDAALRLGAAERGPSGWLLVDGRRVRLGVFSVEIEPHEFAAIAEDSWFASSAERLRRSLRGQSLILGVDRMDPTKGLLQRMTGYRRLLETRQHWHGRVTFLQIAAESRKDVPAYQELRAEVEREAGSINSLFAEPDWTPLRLIARAGARNTIAGYMREARVGLVTPLRDGMNLVAKEYIAAQDPQDPGVLVLSRFAGAARQLRSALIVNPYDPDEMADALDQALTMSLAERKSRWQEAWHAIRDTSALAWGRTFVAALLRATSRRPVHVGAGEPGALYGIRSEPGGVRMM